MILVLAAATAYISQHLYGRPGKRSAAKVTGIVALVASAFSYSLLTINLITSDDASIDRSVSVVDEGIDGTIDCVVGPRIEGASPCSDQPSRLIGMSIITLNDVTGTDPDDDGLLEWICDAGESQYNIVPEAFQDLVVGDPNPPIKFYGCTEVEVAVGPSSDSFLLSDGLTVVERIDVNEDGTPDLIRVGNEPTQQLPRGSSFWRDLALVLAPAGALVVAALIGREWGRSSQPDAEIAGEVVDLDDEDWW